MNAGERILQMLQNGVSNADIMRKLHVGKDRIQHVRRDHGLVGMQAKKLACGNTAPEAGPYLPDIDVTIEGDPLGDALAAAGYQRAVAGPWSALPVRQKLLQSKRKDASHDPMHYPKPIGPANLRIDLRLVCDGQVILNRTRGPRTIMIAVAEEHGLTVEDMLSSARMAGHVKARAVCAHRLHKSGKSLPQVGELMGGRDHTTIMYLIHTYDENGVHCGSYRRSAPSGQSPSRNSAGSGAVPS